MISFDTLFTAIVSIVIFYISTTIVLILEQKKNENFQIKKALIMLSAVCLFLLVLCNYVYHGGYIPDTLISFQNNLQPIFDFILKSKLFPFYKPEFHQDYFILIYIVGLISFSCLFVMALGSIFLDHVSVGSAVLFICILLIFALPALHIELWISSGVYNFLVRFDFWVVFVGNIFVNFAIVIVLFGMLAKILDS